MIEEEQTITTDSGRVFRVPQERMEKAESYLREIALTWKQLAPEIESALKDRNLERAIGCLAVILFWHLEKAKPEQELRIAVTISALCEMLQLPNYVHRLDQLTDKLLDADPEIQEVHRTSGGDA